MSGGDKERRARAHSCFNLSVYYRNLGNEILRPARERPFELLSEAVRPTPDLSKPQKLSGPRAIED